MDTVLTEAEQLQQSPEEMLAVIERADEAGEDIYDAAVNAGIAWKDGIENRKWNLGDLALLLERKYRKGKYGKDIIGTFAADINVEKGRVREYRTVCGFWEISARAEILKIPIVTYTHMRDAMKFGNLPEALAFLEEVADNEWTVEQARIELAKRLGKPEPAQKLIDVTTLSYAVSDDLMTITFKVTPNIGLPDVKTLKAMSAEGKLVRLVIFEGK